MTSYDFYPFLSRLSLWLVFCNFFSDLDYRMMLCCIPYGSLVCGTLGNRAFLTLCFTQNSWDATKLQIQRRLFCYFYCHTDEFRTPWTVLTNTTMHCSLGDRPFLCTESIHSSAALLSYLLLAQHSTLAMEQFYSHACVRRRWSSYHSE